MVYENLVALRVSTKGKWDVCDLDLNTVPFRLPVAVAHIKVYLALAKNIVLKGKIVIARFNGPERSGIHNPSVLVPDGPASLTANGKGVADVIGYIAFLVLGLEGDIDGNVGIELDLGGGCCGPKGKVQVADYHDKLPCDGGTIWSLGRHRQSMLAKRLWQIAEIRNSLGKYKGIPRGIGIIAQIELAGTVFQLVGNLKFLIAGIGGVPGVLVP